ncbi:MAG TPA: carbohydrate ABC transporter permease [Pseudothermotoga sp.]|mgnify:CR=1 FL=1|nr:carbohydrate ABC transporter permease [Pseudothermotoga sp.]HPP70617.1 carbohydrate ABC transporter permease [Pseudothermotoga sp.]
MNKKVTKIFLEILRYTIIVFGAFWMILPFFWLFSASLMTPQELLSDTPRWLPERPQWGNYLQVLKRVPIFTYYKNSVIVATSVTVLVILTSSMAGFAFAKLRFRGRRILFSFVLSTMMFPVFIFLIPVYYLMKLFGWLNSYLSLIVPFAVSGYGIFLLRQFVMTIPDELLDSARLDGAKEFRIYSTIILPLIKPALATLAILTFIGQWNSFLWPLIVTSNAQKLITLPVGISRLSLAFSTTETQHLILTALVYQVVPMVILFLYLQRYYVKGFVLSGFSNL